MNRTTIDGARRSSRSLRILALTAALFASGSVAFPLVALAQHPMAPAGGAPYVPVVPERLLDTRSGVGAPTGPLGAGGTIQLDITGGEAGVADDAAAVVVNVTAVDPQAAGFVTVYPCGSARPEASNLNVRPGVTIPNLVVVKVGTGGRICLFADVSMHLLADVSGWYPAGSGLNAVVPQRLLDTRSGAGTTAAAPASADDVIRLDVTAGAGVPDDVAAVVLNVTAVDPRGPGYVTVYPCGSARPEASNLNTSAGVTSPNLVVAKVGGGGEVCLYTSVGTHLLADISGWYAAGAGLTPLVPDRLLDTRSGIGAAAGLVTPGGTVSLEVTGGPSNVPTTAAAVVVNVTAADPQAAGYVTVYPCGAARPEASNLNLQPGVTVPNSVVAKVGSGGRICLFTDVATHLLVDINGWLEGASDAGEPTDTTELGLDASGIGVTGGATVSGLPDEAAGLAPGPEMRSPDVPDAGAPDVDAATSIDGAPIMPVGSPLHRPGGLTEMLVNEPIYPIGESGYASSVSPAIGRLIMWRNDATYGWYRANSCSGTVVSRTLVLTAAHCLRDGNGYWAGYTFVPGLYGTSQPYGEWSAAGSRAIYPTYYDSLSSSPVRYAFDYAFVKFDPANNGGHAIGDSTGSFQIYQGVASTTPNKFAVGYPAEGYYNSKNGGWCDAGSAWCYPYYCSSATAGVAELGNGWKSAGFGCDGNGGMSGGGIFSQIGGTWYVVSVVSTGGHLISRNGTVCTNRAVCNWYMANTWGPQFEAGYLDTLYHQANAM